MKRMAQSNVLIVGLDGVGVELGSPIIDFPPLPLLTSVLIDYGCI